MANPQVENGHTKIANEILDAFCLAFPGGSKSQVLLAIIRRTYGWQKKQDHISLSQLVDMTGLCRRSVIYALQNLEAQRFITVQRQRGASNVNEINTVGLQKNYDLWVVQRNSHQYDKQLSKQREKYHEGVVQRIGGSAKNRQKVVQRNGENGQIFAPTKEIKKTKENNIYIYGEFQNVHMAEKDYQKLTERFGPDRTKELVERLSAYIESQGKDKYKSHYATILNWQRRDGDNAKVGSSRALPKAYTPTPDYPDL